MSKRSEEYWRSFNSLLVTWVGCKTIILELLMPTLSSESNWSWKAIMLWTILVSGPLGRLNGRDRQLKVCVPDTEYYIFCGNVHNDGCSSRYLAHMKATWLAEGSREGIRDPDLIVIGFGFLSVVRDTITDEWVAKAPGNWELTNMDYCRVTVVLRLGSAVRNSFVVPQKAVNRNPLGFNDVGCFSSQTMRLPCRNSEETCSWKQK